jgi:hypothetical protein
VSPGASIVTLGYPKVLPEQVPSGLSWWSPFSWTAISQQRADMANQLVSALNTANNEATSVVAVQHASLHFLYADISGALQGKGPFKPQRGKNDAASTSIKTSQPNSKQSQPNSKQQTIIGNDLLPYVGQAVDNELVAKGVTGSQNIPQITPTARWKLIVVVPVELGPEKTRQANPSSGAAVSPRNNVAYPQQPRQVPGDVSPSIRVPAGISVPSAATGPQRQGDHSRSHTDTGQPAATPQPGDTGQPSAAPRAGDTGQPAATPQPGDTGQPAATSAPAGIGRSATTPGSAGVDQPATTSAPAGIGQPATTPAPASAGQPATTSAPAGVGQPATTPAPASAGQPAATPLPAGAGLPAATQPVSCTFAEIAACSRQGFPPGNGGAAASPPVMPVPPAPLPPPITPSQSPGPTANPASPNPASPSPDGTGATTTPAGGAAATDGGAAVTPGGATSATGGAASTLGGAASVQSVTPPAPVTSTQAAAPGGA